MHIYLAIALVTCAAALLLTPLAGRLARAMGLVDSPGVRKVHAGAVPYLGGAAIVGALALGGVVLVLLARDFSGSLDRLDPRMLVLLGASGAMFVLGLLDDVFHVRPLYKLAAQVLAASLVYACGIQIQSVHLADGLVIDLGWFGAVITVLWIVGVTNAVNIIDGLDGLAAGISAVACAAIAYVSVQIGYFPLAVLMVAVLGALLGFLPYNLHPARIFLGDSGALFLGFLLSSASVYSATKSAAFVSLVVPAIALSIPILDTLFAMLRRLIERRSVFSPDRNHIHHRLLALGVPQGKAVKLLLFVSASTTFAACLLMGQDSPTRILAFSGILVLQLLLFRAAGAIRLRESYRAFRSIAASAKRASVHQREHDELQLHFRESESIDEWWDSVSLAAQRLGFSRVALQFEGRDGTPRDLQWEATSGPNGCFDAARPVTVTIPVRHRRSGPAVEIAVDVPSSESLENVGRRITLFGRLLDEHSIAELPRDEKRIVPAVPVHEVGSARNGDDVRATRA